MAQCAQLRLTACPWWEGSRVAQAEEEGVEGEGKESEGRGFRGTKDPPEAPLTLYCTCIHMYTLTQAVCIAHTIAHMVLI